MRKQIQSFKDLQAKREQDHLDHIEWINQENHTKDQEVTLKIGKLQLEISQLKHAMT